MKPNAPGTRSHSAGSIVTADDGPLRDELDRPGEGDDDQCADEPDSSGDSNTLPMRCADEHEEQDDDEPRSEPLGAPENSV